ncbi:MAG: ion transporter [Lachnospiraceae bacterium]
MLRKEIYQIVKKGRTGETASQMYDLFITIVAFISIVPLMFKSQNAILNGIDLVTVYILFADYIFRWMSYDYLSDTDSKWAFVKYPFTPMAIIELVSILPSLGLIGNGFRILRMLRIFKALQYSQSFGYIIRVFQKERQTLISMLMIALVYIFISALAIFSQEPQTFDNFFEALYWATTALTTVGYGDIYPVSYVGRLISMISSIFGIAIIALPAGTITAGFVEEMNRVKQEKEAAKEEKSNEH